MAMSYNNQKYLVEFIKFHKDEHKEETQTKLDAILESLNKDIKNHEELYGGAE